jgi:hypothetical protein
VLTAGSWLALLFLPHGLPSMLAGCGIVAAHAIVSVAIGGALAEIGRRGGATGRLAAAWSVSIALAQLGGIALRTPVVGLPAAVGVCAGLAAIVAISMVVSLGTDVAPAPVTPAGTSLPAYLRTRAVWTAAAVVLLAILGHVPDAAIAPGTWPWPLGPVSLTGRLAGAGIYAFVCRRLPFPGGVRLALGLNVIATFALMRASQQAWTVLMVMTATLGAVEGFKFAALNDLFFRASPPRHEGFVCALLTAVAATGWTASRLTADAFRSSVFDITTVAAAAGAAALFTSFLLPASLVSPREGEVEAPSASAHGP